MDDQIVWMVFLGLAGNDQVRDGRKAQKSKRLQSFDFFQIFLGKLQLTIVVTKKESRSNFYIADDGSHRKFSAFSL